MGRIMYGLLGEKLGHSLSPSIHKMIFEELGIDAGYNLFEVEKSDLKDAMYGFRALGIRGINVTIPYKIEVMQYLDEISPEAAKISAVNTIFFEDGKMKGYNTDYHGFGMLLKRNGIETEGRSAVILGSGGSAKAVWQYLADSGARDIKVVSRDSSRQITGFGDSCIISYEELRQIDSGDIIINCTPSGMYPNTDASPVEKEVVSRFSAAVDLIYNPKKTMFLRYAGESGIKAVNGLYMLVGQAVKSQEIWNGIRISDDVTESIFMSTSELI